MVLPAITALLNSITIDGITIQTGLTPSLSVNGFREGVVNASYQAALSLSDRLKRSGHCTQMNLNFQLSKNDA